MSRDLKQDIAHGTRRVRMLLELLDNPQNKFKAVHVAGTNGKGSVCAYIASMLQTMGVKVGRFNSPHLVEVRDAIRINGDMIDNEGFQQARQRVDASAQQLLPLVDPSPFERLVCTAYLLFAEKQVTFGVVEVGLGGRDDATTVFDAPAVTVITSIGLDHTAILGPDLASIAHAKAGIIRPQCPVVVAPQSDPEIVKVISDEASRLGSPLVCVSTATVLTTGRHVLPADGGWIHAPCEYPVPLQGDFQRDNAATAVTAMFALQAKGHLQLTHDGVASGMGATRWPGRLEWINALALQQRWHLPHLLVDGAHNPAAAVALRTYVDSLSSQYSRILWIMGVTAGKDVDGLCSTLVSSNDMVFAVPFSQPQEMPWVQCMPPSDVARHAQHLAAKVRACATLEEALDRVETVHPSSQDLIVLCGSLYLVADLYRLLSLTA